jgi:hypothetical protein
MRTGLVVFKIRSLRLAPFIFFAVFILFGPHSRASEQCLTLFSSRIAPSTTRTYKPTFPEDLNSAIRDALAKEQDDFFAERLPKAGLGSIELIEAKLKEVAAIRPLYDLLKNEKFDVVIHRPQDARNSLRAYGTISNYSESNISIAAMAKTNPRVYRNTRLAAEAHYLGMSLADYIETPAEQRAKYGLLRLNWDAPNYKKNESTDNYGSDVYILKKDRIKIRTRFFMGDSLDRLNNAPAARNPVTHLVDPIQWHSSFWDESLIPWDARVLFAIEAFPGFKKGILSIYEKLRSDDLRSFYRGLAGAEMLTDYDRSAVDGSVTWDNAADYIEAHVFGELSINDVEAFEFRKDPPDAAFASFLRAKGIRILDGRGDRPIEWKDGAQRNGRI